MATDPTNILTPDQTSQVHVVLTYAAVILFALLAIFANAEWLIAGSKTAAQLAQDLDTLIIASLPIGAVALKKH